MNAKKYATGPSLGEQVNAYAMGMFGMIKSAPSLLSVMGAGGNHFMAPKEPESEMETLEEDPEKLEKEREAFVKQIEKDVKRTPIINTYLCDFKQGEVKSGMEIYQKQLEDLLAALLIKGARVPNKYSQGQNYV